MTVTLEQIKATFPIGSQVLYTRPGEDDPDRFLIKSVPVRFKGEMCIPVANLKRDDGDAACSAKAI